MLNQQLKTLKTKFAHLSPIEQQDCEEVLTTLILLMEESAKVQKPYLKEVRRYLSSKFNREQHRNEPLDLFKLRSLLGHRGKYPPAYHEQTSQAIWTILPELSAFNTLKHLENFLGYTLQATIISFAKIKTKRQLVAAYKKVYDTFDRATQEKVMQKLAVSALVAAPRDELKKFNEMIK
jgi:hypothetical protein